MPRDYAALRDPPLTSMKTLLITGTDTGVGKTWVASTLLRSLRAAGRSVGAYKPACSGSELDEGGSAIWTDVESLRNAMGRPEIPIDAICPQRFLAPLAPPLAARREGRTVDRGLLTGGLDWWRGKAEIVVIEGAGGIHCPMTDDATLADLAMEWNAPTLVVSANRLGTINHTLLTFEALRARGVPVLGFVLNDVSPDADPESRTDHVDEIERRGRARCLATIAWEQATFPGDLTDSIMRD